MNSKIRLFGSFILFILIGLIDQLSKQHIMQYAKQKYYLNTLLAFTPPTLNRGISGGMLHFTSTTGFIVLTILILFIILGFALYTYRRWSAGCTIIGETFVLAGALSNLLDRVLYHGVVDFILLQYAQWSFPVFNIADAAITIGVIIMFLGALMPCRPSRSSRWSA